MNVGELKKILATLPEDMNIVGYNSCTEDDYEVEYAGVVTAGERQYYCQGDSVLDPICKQYEKGTKVLCFHDSRSLDKMLTEESAAS